MAENRVFKPTDFDGLANSTVQLQQKALQVKQKFDFRRSYFHTTRNSILDFEIWSEINDKLVSFDQVKFVPWNQKWANVQRTNTIDEYVKYFEEGNNMFLPLEEIYRTIKPQYLNTQEIESLQKELLVKLEQDILALKNDVLVKINEGINNLIEFKAETGLNKIFSDNIGTELENNIVKRRTFMWAFIGSLVAITAALISSFFIDFFRNFDLATKISLKLAVSIPLGFLSYFFFSQYKLYQIIVLKLSHLNGFLGGGATYLGQLTEQDAEVKRETNKRLAQMFIELDDIMIDAKSQKHPTEKTIKGITEKIESLSSSVSDILTNIKNFKD